MRQFSDDHRKNLGIAQLGELNHEWKGNDVGYVALHAWVRRHKPKPEFCEFCGLVPPRHLSNMTGLLSRDFANWRYLCVKCHSNYDWRFIKEEIKKRVCDECKSLTTFTEINKRTGSITYHWHKSNDCYLCENCYRRKQRREGKRRDVD